MHPRTRTHTRTHAHTHARTHTHTRSHTRTHTQSHTHARTRTGTHARTRTHTHTHTHSHTNTHTRTHARTHARTHTHTHTHTHTNRPLPHRPLQKPHQNLVSRPVGFSVPEDEGMPANLADVGGAGPQVNRGSRHWQRTGPPQVVCFVCGFFRVTVGAYGAIVYQQVRPLRSQSVRTCSRKETNDIRTPYFFLWDSLYFISCLPEIGVARVALFIAISDARCFVVVSLFVFYRYSGTTVTRQQREREREREYHIYVVVGPGMLLFVVVVFPRVNKLRFRG